MQRSAIPLLFLVPGGALMAQTPWPDLCIQNASWSSDTHHFAVTQPILSPCDPASPVSIASTADAEFVSGTSVRLTDGFHTGGFSGSGQFHAHIDASLGAPADLVLIAPDPGTHIVDKMVHVNKWEKLEVGLRLPESYQLAIDSFFTHYYANGEAQAATPGSVDTIHDLNPYADDSLQVVMRLTSPTGQQRMRWGFFMREVRWTGTSNSAKPTAYTTSPLNVYKVRFRFAPDEEGPWQFSLSIQAPHTATVADVPLPALDFTGYAFVCDPPLADNHGHLEVNANNRRTLKFEDGAPFFAMGTDMADMNHAYMPHYWNDNVWWHTFFRRDFRTMKETMEQLHSVGGNFMRMWLQPMIFAPEFVNLGVYDAYVVPVMCDSSESLDDPDCSRGFTSGHRGNGQYQCWAFDSMLYYARENDIYIQLCIEPYYPGIDAEKTAWGAHPYVIQYLDPYRRNNWQGWPANPYDMKWYFYQNGDTLYRDEGVFYYWKRRYKYIMSRWGYSVNIAAIEPFNETDQMLSYKNLAPGGLGTNTPLDTCNSETQPDEEDIPFRGLCRENRGPWKRDSLLPGIVDQWLTDLIGYIRGDVDTADVVGSPLGEKEKLFIMSYTDYMPASSVDLFTGVYLPDHYKPFTNPQVDMIDVHRGMNVYTGDDGTPDDAISGAYEHALSFRSNYPYANPSLGDRKPMNQGEFNYYTRVPSGPEREIEKIFHNYDVSFHNEIWASAFSGKFATGTTWHWERVFWWPDALPIPSNDPNNIFPLNPFEQFYNVLDSTNRLSAGGIPVHIKNRRLHHHFKPLADLLARPSWQELGFFDGDYTTNKAFSTGEEIESYYLKDSNNGVAIGWVHNRNAWVMNNYYLANTDTTQNFFGCNSPSDQSITLTGFEPNTDYHITWFPTHMNTVVQPLDTVWTSDATGGLLLDLATAPFGDTIQFYLDTLHSDYAFVITPDLFVRSMQAAVDDDTKPDEEGWDFMLYPNPARDELFLRFQDDVPKEIVIHDLSGRRVQKRNGVSTAIVHLPVGQLAKGVYSVWASDGTNARTKRLIIH